MWVIHIFTNPTFPSPSSRDFVNHGHEKTIQEIPDPDSAREKRRPEALHVLGRLVVEKLQQPDRVEHVSNTEQNILGHQVEYAHRDDFIWAVDFVDFDHMQSFDFDCVGYCNG